MKPTVTAFLLFLVGEQVRAQDIPAPIAEVCQGEELERVSQGCMTAADCEAAAISMGLSIGSEEWAFEGNWADKGCIYYPADHPLYPNQAYFGYGGTCTQLKMTPMADAIRISCDGSTRPPFDPERCQGEDLCRNAEDCQASALALGLNLGGFDPFVGDFHVKGCIFYPLDHPEYPGEAYWGSGASICGQLRADPREYDGSVRLTCGGRTATDSNNNQGNDGEETMPGFTSAPTFEETESDTVARPRPAVNATAVTPATTGRPQESNNATAEKAEEGEEPFEMPGPSVSAFEAQEASSAASTMHLAALVIAALLLGTMN